MHKVDFSIKKVDFLFLAIVLAFNNVQPSHCRGISDSYQVARTLTIADGLQSQDINDIFFDDRGFAWIGTFGGGLSRFDGESFITFSSLTNPEIKSDYVNQIVQDNFDRLWVAGNRGVDVIDLPTLRPVSFSGDISRLLTGVLVNSIIRSSDGSIWYPTKNKIFRISFHDDGSKCQADSLVLGDSSPSGDVSLYDVENDGSVWFVKNGTFHKIISNTGHGMSAIDILPSVTLGEINKVSSFLRKDEILWIGTTMGLCRINLRTGVCHKYWEDSLHATNGVSHNEITSLCLSQEGEVIVGTLAGVHVYDSHNNEFSEISSRHDCFGNRILPGNMVHSVVCRGSWIWVGLEVKGVTVLRKKSLSLVNFSNDNVCSEALSNSPIRALHLDNTGLLWLSSTKNGVFACNLSSGEDYSIDRIDGLADNVNAFCEDNRGRLWFGTATGRTGCCRIKGRKVINITPAWDPTANRDIADIFQMLFDEYNDCIWILAYSGLYRYDLKDNSMHCSCDDIHYCFSGFIDDESRLWVSHSRGISIFDLKTMEHTEPAGAPMCLTMLQFEDKVLLGTFDQGVWIVGKKFTGNLEVIEKYDVDGGLCDNRVRGMAVYGGILWVTTENGLSRINLSSGEASSYGRHDGLETMAFCENSIAIDKAGKVYLGRKEGLSWIEPGYLFRNNTLDSDIVISACISEGKQKNLVYENGINIHERDKDFSIIFSDLSYNDYGIQYQSRMDYNGNEWSPIYGNRKFIRLGRVPPGNHRIEIRSVDSRGQELSNAALSLNVKPMFYKSWWFILIDLIFAALSVMGFISWRTSSLKKKKEQLQEEVDKKTRILLEQKSVIEKELKVLSEQNHLLLKQNELLAGNKLLTSNAKQTEDSRFMKKAMSTIRRMYKDSDLDVNSFSEEMGMSRSVLNEKIHAAIGLSIAQFIRDYRLNVAKEMISNGIQRDKNISEIAYEVGFNDPKYFTRCFTKQFGIAPSDLQKEQAPKPEA